MDPLPRFRDYTAVRDYLYALKGRGVIYHQRASGATVGLERMRVLSQMLGYPERAFPVVHVAGTNGKGSTSAMIESIARAAGWRTGLYTSPHLVHQAERVQVDRHPIAESEIVSGVNRIHESIERAGGLPPEMFPSFFEFMTGLAFLHFAGCGVQLGVIEVGLGGRLDATNVVDPEVSVITSIGFDHCEILGDSLSAIAAEKAGIIKPGCPVVMGRLPPEAAAVVRQIAQERGSPLHEVEVRYGTETSAYPRTNLEGDYQRWNAASAALVAQLLEPRFKTGPGAVEAGLACVEWAGRWQRIRLDHGGLLILDASHNPEGARGLDDNLSRLVAETGQRPVVVCGVLGGFRARAILPVVARHARAIHLVVPHQERASGYGELEEALPPEARGRTSRGQVEHFFPAPGCCTLGGPDQPVVVTGSIYLLGEVLQRLRQPMLSGQERLQDW